MAASRMGRFPLPIAINSRTSLASTQSLQQKPRKGTQLRLASYSSRQHHKPSRELEQYYNDLLAQPNTSPSSNSAAPPAPNNPAHSKRAEPMSDYERTQRARVVFGSRLSGPVQQAQRRLERDRASTRIAGILVPPRPEEPDNCCMSGCVNCVWDRYREELEEWAEARGEADARLESRARQEKKEAGTPTHVTVSMDDDGGGSETNWSLGEIRAGGKKTRDLFGELPVGIREFMKTEKRLKAKKGKVPA